MFLTIEEIYVRLFNQKKQKQSEQTVSEDPNQLELDLEFPSE